MNHSMLPEWLTDPRYCILEICVGPNAMFLIVRTKTVDFMDRYYSISSS